MSSPCLCHATKRAIHARHVVFLGLAAHLSALGQSKKKTGNDMMEPGACFVIALKVLYAFMTSHLTQLEIGGTI